MLNQDQIHVDKDKRIFLLHNFNNTHIWSREYPMKGVIVTRENPFLEHNLLLL